LMFSVSRTYYRRREGLGGPFMNAVSIGTNTSPWWMRVVFGRNPKRTLIRLTCLIVLSIVVFRFVLIPIRVSGLSMLPTYTDGRVSVINHQAYRWKKPKRRDVVAFRLPEEGNVVLLKRIIGLPGERIVLVKGRAYINGQLLDEPYARTGREAPTIPKEIHLASDEYFVIGDNRNISVIRRIPEHYILGKVLF